MARQRRAPRAQSGQNPVRIRRQEDERRRRGVLIVGVAALLLIFLIPVYGYYASFIGPPRQVIAQVNDHSFNLGYLLKLLRMQQAGTMAQGQSLNLGSLPFQMVNILAENELIKQTAPRYNITIGQSELDTEIRLRIMGDASDSETSEEQLEREFQELYGRYLNLIQLSEEEHREVVSGDMYREAMREYMGESVPMVQPQARVYKTTLPAAENVDEIADEFRTEFARGAPFASLVERFSTNNEEIRTGGELGWLPKDILPQIDSLLFEELNVGELSVPIPEFDSSSGEQRLVLYLVTEKSDARELTEDHWEMLKVRALQQWLTDERAINIIETQFTSEHYDWIIKQLNLSSASTSQ